MARIEILDNFSTGTHSDMIRTPSSPGLSPVSWTGAIEFWVAVIEGGDTYLKVKRVQAYNCTGDGGLTVNTYYWPAVPQIKTSDFDINWSSGESKWNMSGGGVKFNWSTGNESCFLSTCKMNVTGSGSSGSASMDYQAPAGVSEGGDSSALTQANGWLQVTKLENWPTTAATKTLYASCPILSNMETVVNINNTCQAYPFTITADANPKLFDYYPWERYIDGSWKSLNRSGTSNLQPGLNRYSGGWQKCTNIAGVTDDSHGFRHNGSDWQISPKVG